MTSKLFVACVALLAVGLANAGEFEDPAVAHLTSSNYDDSVGVP